MMKASPTSEQNAAIAQAKSYANSLPISKKSLYKQLTSEYGEISGRRSTVCC